jgi:endonuclease/exonuclease/phosphatase family metal-dependent hydrolase
MLRRIVDKDLVANPNARLVVLGDFNDVKDSDSTKEIIGRGRFKLVDTRPAERNADNAPVANAWFQPRDVTWTHYYGKEDTYSRIDYVLLSPAMARAWDKAGTYVLTQPNWGVASDHRPIVATFKVGNNWNLVRDD